MWSKDKGKHKKRLFFASDIHGSVVGFKKFLNALNFYKADILIYGGDLTGKAIVPLIKEGDHYVTSSYGNTIRLNSEAEASDFKNTLTNKGFYPVVMSRSEYTELQNDPKVLHEKFSELMYERINFWKKLAEERLAPEDRKVYWQAGNDDLLEIDEVLNGESSVNIGDRITEIDDYYVLGLTYVNVTPWNTYRDISEDKMKEAIDGQLRELNELGENSRVAAEEKIKEVIKRETRQIENADNVIMAYHAPPFNTSLDLAPRITEDMTYAKVGGQPDIIHVGSTSVREAIEDVQPLLSLHGHIHESKGAEKVGKTLCLNPGSEYSEGILHGALVNLDGNKVKSYVFTSG